MARFEPIMGKYVYLEVQGIEYRVYFEENGKGIPLVCQHTAGPDGSQWRHLMNDEQVTSRYRVIAPDLPYHGKSLPPESVEWWKQEYRLTKSFLLDFHMALIEALGLPKIVYIGASMGGHLACDLALEHPEKLRAVIGIEAGLHTRRASNYLDWQWHPRISSEFKGALMMSLMSPGSPEKYRRETAWGYLQSAPPVNKGDAYYYFMDHDVTGKTHLIDTSRVAVYLLTGEYDASVCPADTRKLAEQIKGAKFTEMKGLGHFAMCENYEVFRKYLMPILDEIAGE